MTILEAKGLSKRFGDNEALTEVNLRIASGRITGLLGPNGSGKSTLIKLACGLLQPTAGEILVAEETPGARTKALISYLPERVDIPLWMRAGELLRFYADFFPDFDRERALGLLAALDIEERQPLREMSKGTREKVQLIAVMSRRAKLYLLDEPIGGVDPATRDYILSTIVRNTDPEAAVVISTHLIADVEPVLDDVVFLARGHVALEAAADELRETHGMSVDRYFREVFRWS